MWRCAVLPLQQLPLMPVTHGLQVYSLALAALVYLPTNTAPYCPAQLQPLPCQHQGPPAAALVVLAQQTCGCWVQVELETRVELYEAQVAKLQAQVAQADNDKAALEGAMQALQPQADGSSPDVVRTMPTSICCENSCF